MSKLDAVNSSTSSDKNGMKAASRWDMPSDKRFGRKRLDGPASMAQASTLSSAHVDHDGRQSNTTYAPRHRATRANGRVSDSLVSQQLRDMANHNDQHAALKDPIFKVIRQKLDAERLLHELSHSHGVLPEKYTVVRVDDGSQRIRSGNRHLNVADFLTKELHLSWKEAAPMLRSAYARQEGGSIEVAPRATPRVGLWKDYSQARDAAGEARRQAVKEQRDSEQRRRVTIKSDFESTRDNIRSDPSISYRDRRSMLSVTRMDRINREAELWNAITGERATLKLRHGGAERLTFSDYLQERAQSGDSVALAEVRRTGRATRKKRDIVGPTSQPNEIRPASIAPANEIIYRRPTFTHHVHHDGDVSYRRDGQDVVLDRGSSVLVLQRDRDVVETGLRLAMAKYGATLALSGDESFKREAARLSADLGLNVKFSDDKLNRLASQRLAEKIAERHGKARVTSNVPSGATSHPIPDSRRSVNSSSIDQETRPAVGKPRTPGI